MGKSFRERLAGLEALERAQQATHAATTSPLSVEDADALSDDEVLQLGLEALAEGVLQFSMYVVDWSQYGRLHPTWYTPESSPDHWQRVGERAEAVRKARGLHYVPATDEQLREVLDLLERRELTVLPLEHQYHHHTWFRDDERAGVALGDPRWEAYRTLRLVLDCLHVQTGMPFCESNEQATEIISDLLYEKHAPTF